MNSKSKILVKNLNSFLIFLVMLLGSIDSAFAKETFSLGYRLNYTTQTLKASKISSSFPDFDSGHTSSFFLQRSLGDHFYFEIAPGAWNSEASTGQFTYQYNTIGLGYNTGKSFVFNVGIAIGAGLFALTSHDGTSADGEIQSGTILRKEVGLYTGHLGLGYKPGTWTFLLELRQIGFFDEQFSKLDSLNTGLSIITEI